MRRQARRPTVALPDDPDRFDLNPSPSADEALDSFRIGDDVQKALLSLPLEFREAVVMCDVIGLSYDEIALAAEVPVGTVRSRIHRGRKLLREKLV
jgi:RNA polymerase sigma-70 factor (ECF subfamily)